MAWLFAIYVLGGLISVIFSLRYRLPIAGAYTLPGAAILAASLQMIPFNEAVGAFIASGVMVLVLGASGLIGRLAHWLPVPIVMAMIAGALFRFATGAVDSVVSAPWVAGIAALAFFLTGRLLRSVPPVLVAGVVGLVMALWLGQLKPAEVGLEFVMPGFTAPAFSWQAFFAIAVPLTALVIGAENAQAIGVLFMLFGLFAGLAVPFILALPKALIMVIAGLAMIGVLLGAFQQAFRKNGPCQVGAFVALTVAMSKFSLLGISSPFWALLLGVAVSALLGEIGAARRAEAGA